MSCYSIVTLQLKLKATPDEIAEAMRTMKFSVIRKDVLLVNAGNVQFRRDTAQSDWNIAAPSDFDAKRFQREVARAKALNEAQRLGYRVIREERQGERIVLRLAVR
jgi:hypothetical protein